MIETLASYKFLGKSKKFMAIRFALRRESGKLVKLLCDRP
jgi:hypothetical protein